ncbi:DsrE family protein [Runella sp. MFBS21]|uniref:DsrE family protein n=1 Tax=Runella sp. MFBS21 TaxID=3034018 RepID=UPI0023F6683E|nr:DsrE family protein [Runella sp. MFBS21]MDF7820062.1 DsrE family protein [Runella sp. MFBS21]
MKIKLLLSFLFVFVLIGNSFAQNKKNKKEPIHRLVFQLSSPDTSVYRALTRQISNVLNYWPTAQIEVVVHNKGVSFMRKDQSTFQPEIQSLKDKGVEFAVCENTLKQQKLSKNQILPQARFVPVGIAELVLKQEDGWAYIKAGF